MALGCSLAAPVGSTRTDGKQVKWCRELGGQGQQDSFRCRCRWRGCGSGSGQRPHWGRSHSPRDHWTPGLPTAEAAVLWDMGSLPGPRSLWADSRGVRAGGWQRLDLSSNVPFGELVTQVERSHRVLHSKEPRVAGKTVSAQPPPVLDCVGRREGVGWEHPSFYL